MVRTTQETFHMGKKLLAAVLGGLAFFAWSSVAHMFIGLGDVGINDIPNEPAVVNAIKTNITQPGLYRIPGFGLPSNATQAQKMAKMKDLVPAMKAGPVGIMVIHPEGTEPIAPRQLITELITNIVQVFLAVLLLGYTALSSFVARWRFITIAGILAAISTNISYWNWYGYPGNYTLSYICTIAMGFVFAGLVAAALLKPSAIQTRASAA
jgi:hypothetical protein